MTSDQREKSFRGRDAHYCAPPAQIRTSPIKAYGSHLGCLTAKLSVHAPVRGTCFPGSGSGACRPVACSPRSPPLAPPAPRRVAPPSLELRRACPPCSPASQLLRRSQTSLRRASPASAHRLPDADRTGLRRRSTQRPPGSRPRSVRTCQGLRPRRADRLLAMTHAIVLPSAGQTASALRTKLSRLDGWPVRSPADASRPASRRTHARLGADVGRYSFIAVDLHHLLLAGLPAHLTPVLKGRPARDAPPGSRAPGRRQAHPAHSCSNSGPGAPRPA